MLEWQKMEAGALWDANEFMEVVTLSVDDFKKHLKSGNLTDVATGYLGLDQLGLL